MTPHPGDDLQAIVVGAGLTGCLLALRLAGRGDRVTLLERRPDPAETIQEAGRSINLALSRRGLDALARVGLDDVVISIAVAVSGRRMHARDGNTSHQPYGITPDEVLWSIDRDGLNGILIDAARDVDGIDVRFGCAVVDADLELPNIEVEQDSTVSTVDADVVFGADGAYSAIRRRLQRTPGFDYQQSILEYGYKELTIPADAARAGGMEVESLHIWPRGEHMLMALANPDGSFTCTLFWPFEGAVGFETIKTAEEVEAAFIEHFPDSVELFDDLSTSYLSRPTGSLVTIRCAPWYLGDRALILGDAAHAVVPFYGQGANAAMEDVTLLIDALDRAPDRAEAFRRFGDSRKPDTDVLADLALGNFVEMRDTVSSRWFQFERRVERQLHRWFPRWFVPLYTLIAFTRTPYREAIERARWQRRAIIVILVSLVVFLLLAMIGLSTWT